MLSASLKMHVLLKYGTFALPSATLVMRWRTEHGDRAGCINSRCSGRVLKLTTVHRSGVKRMSPRSLPFLIRTSVTWAVPTPFAPVAGTEGRFEEQPRAARLSQ